MNEIEFVEKLLMIKSDGWYGEVPTTGIAVRRSNRQYHQIIFELDIIILRVAPIPIVHLYYLLLTFCLYCCTHPHTMLVG